MTFPLSDAVPSHDPSAGARFEFRGDIPTYVPPDRDEWQAKHGVAPVPLSGVRPIYATRIRAVIDRECSTLSRATALDALSRIDGISQSVHADAELPEDSVVFFDPADGQFWHYPAK